MMSHLLCYVVRRWLAFVCEYYMKLCTSPEIHLRSKGGMTDIQKISPHTKEENQNAIEEDLAYICSRQQKQQQLIDLTTLNNNTHNSWKQQH